MDRREWAGIAALLKRAYPHTPLQAGTLDVYWQALAAYPADAVEAVVREHIATSKFFPAVAELVQPLRQAAAGPVLTPEAAWEEVMAAVRRYSVYAPHPPWSHPAIARAVLAVGGYESICAATAAETAALRAHFYRHIQAHLDREAQERQQAPVRAALAAAQPAQALPAPPAQHTSPAPAATPPAATAPPPDVLAEIRAALAKLGQMPIGPQRTGGRR